MCIIPEVQVIRTIGICNPTLYSWIKRCWQRRAVQFWPFIFNTLYTPIFYWIILIVQRIVKIRLVILILISCLLFPVPKKEIVSSFVAYWLKITKILGFLVNVLQFSGISVNFVSNYRWLSTILFIFQIDIRIFFNIIG